jgi:uncharacterized sodium:solute symporter family permease YidK
MGGADRAVAIGSLLIATALCWTTNQAGLQALDSAAYAFDAKGVLIGTLAKLFS